MVSQIEMILLHFDLGQHVKQLVEGQHNYRFSCDFKMVRYLSGSLLAKLR